MYINGNKQFFTQDKRFKILSYKKSSSYSINYSLHTILNSTIFTATKPEIKRHYFSFYNLDEATFFLLSINPTKRPKPVMHESDSQLGLQLFTILVMYR